MGERAFYTLTANMAHYMSRTPSPILQLGPLPIEDRPNRAASLLTDFIEVAERQRGSPTAEAVYVPLPHESDTGSEADMDAGTAGADTPTRDEHSSDSAGPLPGKGGPSPGTVVDTEDGRRLVLASTAPTYTPPPLGGLHSGLRMVVADLTQTFSPPPDPACGDQWRGPDYVPSPVAELERLEARRAELEAEIRYRNAGYRISWAQGGNGAGAGSQGPSPPALIDRVPTPAPEVRRPRPSVFAPPRSSGGPEQDAPPAYSRTAPTGAGAPEAADLPQRREVRTVTPVPGSNSSGGEERIEASGNSFLEQFIPAEKAPLDAEGDNLAENTAKLVNTLWTLPMTRAETTEIYGTLPRPKNAEGLHKTRMNPEIETTLPARTKDNDAALAAVQWGVQFAARPLARVLDAIETGNPMATKELVATIVTTMKILAKTNNSLLTMRRDNVRPTLQNQLKPLAKKDGGQGFKYLLGEDLTGQVTTLEASRKTANTIMRAQGMRTMGAGRSYDKKPGNFRGGQGRSRPNQYTPRHRQDEGKSYPHRPNGGNQTRPYRGGRGRATNSYRARGGRQQ